MSSEVEVDSDTHNDAPTDVETDAPSDTFNPYIKDHDDYSKYAEDFSRDEFSFYNIIKSYCTGSSIVLSLKINDTILSLSNLSENGIVTEFLRNDEKVNNTFNTIFTWVKNYYGSSKDIKHVLDNVFIGDDEVPLWYVLSDMKDSDDEVADDEFHDKAEEDENVKIEEMRLTAIMNILCMFNVGVIFVYCLTVIVAIDTKSMNPINFQKM